MVRWWLLYGLVLPLQAQGFEQTWVAGSRDATGQIMGGTELRNLAVHRGKLYAGNGYWKDTDPQAGAQILILDHPQGRWRVDTEFAEVLPWGLKRFFGITALQSITLTTDGVGTVLTTPIQLLVAGVWDRTDKTVIFSRNEDTHRWEAMDLSPNPPSGQGNPLVRSISTHQDRKTGVDRVFVGSRPLGIVSGTYDPTVPGKLRWARSELNIPDGDRILGFAESAGVLYATVGASLYRRIDGPKPRWEIVFTQTSLGRKGSGLRGLTALPTGELLMALEGNSAQVLRYDPKTNAAPVQELDVLDFLGQRWGIRPHYAIVAYNPMPTVKDPATGEPVQILGLEANYGPRPRRPTFFGWEPGGWYLLRRPGGRYDLKQIINSQIPVMPLLIAVRTIVASPFDDKTIYLGGFDANGKLVHNTAWLFQAPLSTVLGQK